MNGSILTGYIKVDTYLRVGIHKNDKNNIRINYVIHFIPQIYSVLNV
jgi:hypothetical protein